MMRDSTRLFIAASAIALPCAIALVGNKPPVWAWAGEMLAVALASIGGWLAAKEIVAEEKQNNAHQKFKGNADDA